MNDPGANPNEKRKDSSILCRDHGPVEWLDWTSCPYKDDLAVFRFNHVENAPHRPDWPALLHPDEIERSERYHRNDDRLRSLYARSLLRILVGKYTGQSPLAVRLNKGLGNKPQLSDNPEWHVNATHSGSWILLAISKSNVGIDVEEAKPEFNFTDVMSISYSPLERQYIEADGKSPTRFYGLWTRKESFVKAIGSGIDENLPQIPALTGVHTWKVPTPAAAGAWTIASFYAAEGYPAAVAFNSSLENLRFYSLDHGIFISGN